MSDSTEKPAVPHKHVFDQNKLIGFPGHDYYEKFCKCGKRKPMIPGWIGHHSVSESPKQTNELLHALGNLLEVESNNIPTDNMHALAGFLEKACQEGNRLTEKLREKYPDYVPKKVGIWVGFPETDIGRLNARLVGIIWHLYTWLSR